jgi:DNA polymerase III sliding clamp (beta) subunit (PCNA family)
MKFKVQRSDLLPALTACAAVADPKGVRPEQACVLICGASDGLRLHASNGYQGVKLACAAAGGAGARFLVRAADACARVAAMPDGEMTAAVRDRVVEFVAPGARFSLSLFDSSRASFPEIDVPFTCTVDVADLAIMIGRLAPETSFDEGPDQVRYGIKNGVRLVSSDVQVTGWAWNGVSFARASIASEGPLRAILSKEVASHLRRILAKRKGSAELGADSRHVVIRCGDMSYAATMPDDVLEPFEKLLPPSGGQHLSVGREEFIAALRYVRSLKLLEERVRFRRVEGGVMLRGATPGGEIAERFVAATGEIDNCSFQGQHLASAAAFHDGDKLEIWKQPILSHQRSVNGSPNPLVVRDAGSDDLVLITPMILDAEDLTPESPVGAAA